MTKPFPQFPWPVRPAYAPLGPKLTLRATFTRAIDGFARVLKEDFGASAEGETLGSYYKPSTDSYNFVAMTTPTPSAPNSKPRLGPVVISERSESVAATWSRYFSLLYSTESVP